MLTEESREKAVTALASDFTRKCIGLLRYDFAMSGDTCVALDAAGLGGMSTSIDELGSGSAGSGSSTGGTPSSSEEGTVKGGEVPELLYDL